MKLLRLLSVAFVSALLVGCADVGPKNTRWLNGSPVFSTTNGMSEIDSALFGIRDDGVVVWKANPAMKAKNVLLIK